MVTIATNLGRSGLQDWIIQRISAIILSLYAIFIFAFWLLQANAGYYAWQELFHNNFMRFFTFLTLLSLVAHAWIGIWIITTDYLKITWLRLTTQILVYILLVFYVVWGIQILWD